MMNTCRGDKSTAKDIRQTMKHFVESLRAKKDHSLVRKLELVLEKKRGAKNLDRARTVPETDESISSATESINSPLSTPTSSPPLSPRLFLVAPTPMHCTQAQLTNLRLLRLNDETARDDDSSHHGDWGQFTCIE